jgi:signal transduction histidine kinase
MNTIIGYSEMLLDKIDGPLNEEQEKSLSRIKKSARHLLKLIDDVLNISKIESAKVKLDIRQLDVRKQIDSVLSSFEPLLKQKGLSLAEHVGEDLPTVFGDEEKIRQILASLLSNAVKFTQKGSVTITAAPSNAGIGPGDEPLFLEICIADTGIGIKSEDLEKIFDKFVQVDFTLVRRYEGTGLGLSIAEGLVKLHKGSIWVSSKYGEGSKFCFTLPVKREILEKAS